MNVEQYIFSSWGCLSYTTRTKMEGAIAFYHLCAKSHYQRLKNLQAESDVLTHCVFIVCSVAVTKTW